MIIENWNSGLVAKSYFMHFSERLEYLHNAYPNLPKINKNYKITIASTIMSFKVAVCLC